VHRWRTQVAWAEIWDVHTPRWQRELDNAESGLIALTKALIDFVRTDEPPVAELDRRRTGVTYLLPSVGTDMERLYELITTRLLADLSPEGREAADRLRVWLPCDHGGTPHRDPAPNAM
jgi:hypothetical protein